MLTDGRLERHANSLDLSDLIVRTRAMHPREAARTLIAAIVDANNGHLQDDATVMCLDWHGVGHSLGRRHRCRPRRRLRTVTDCADHSWAMTRGLLR